MVFRVFVEKKPGISAEASGLLNECRGFLGISGLTSIRVLNRYDVEGIDKDLFDYAKTTVFSEPPVDICTEETDLSDAAAVFAVEALPGQFDQRADSAAQCIQLLSQGERPAVRCAKVYALYGELSQQELEAVRRHMINPVESREASLDKPETLHVDYVQPDSVMIVNVHGKAKIAKQLSKAAVIKGGKAINGHNGIRLYIVYMKGLGLVQ